jgi:hypothetical protein
MVRLSASELTKARDRALGHVYFPPLRTQNGRVEIESKKMRQPAFPRGPPPQYYLVSIQLNFAVRMGSSDPG